MTLTSPIKKDFSSDTVDYIIDQDFIPRFTSTATVVIEGIEVGENPELTTMWVGIGYPPCSEIRAVFLGNDGVPKELQGLMKSGNSELCDKTLKMKREVFPIRRGSGNKYINISKLYNLNNTGYSQILKIKNREYYDKMYETIEQRRKSLNK